MALGVATGNVIWPVLALLALNLLVALYTASLKTLKYIALSCIYCNGVQLDHGSVLSITGRRSIDYGWAFARVYQWFIGHHQGSNGDSILYRGFIWIF